MSALWIFGTKCETGQQIICTIIPSSYWHFIACYLSFKQVLSGNSVKWEGYKNRKKSRLISSLWLSLIIDVQCQHIHTERQFVHEWDCSLKCFKYIIIRCLFKITSTANRKIVLSVFSQSFCLNLTKVTDLLCILHFDWIMGAQSIQFFLYKHFTLAIVFLIASVNADQV